MDPRTTTVKRKGVKRRLGRMLRLRPVSEEIWDRLRLAIDLRSDPVYQPLTWVGRNGDASRAQGVVTRWEAMLPVIDELGVASALDIGCNAGWYVLELAARGIAALGVESHPPYHRTAQLALRRSRLEQKAGILELNVTPTNALLLPETDCVVFLAVWHHIVRRDGIDVATDILEQIWRKTRKVLFFETGEEEARLDYGLPALEPDPETWLTQYLERHCPGGSVRHLGRHHGGDGGPLAYRNLFAVVRTA